MPYVHPRQPDYDNWPTDPDNDIFERKRQLLNDIQHRYDIGEFTGKDFNYLFDKTENFWQLFHFFANYRVELETEIEIQKFEIEDLKRQLKEKNDD